LRSGGEAGVEERVHHRVRHQADLDQQGRPPRLERRKVALSLVGITGVKDDQRRELGA
jgi:hypothetical protein